MLISAGVVGAGAKQSVTLTNATTYTLSLWAYVNSGTMSTFSIGYSNDSFTETDCLSNQTLTTAWTYFSCTFTASSPSAGSYIYVKQTDAAVHTWGVDAVQ